VNYEAKWGAMDNASGQINKCADIIRSVSKQTAMIKNNLSLTGSPSALQKIKSELQKCITSIDTCAGKTTAIKNALSDSANMYRANERKLAGVSAQSTAYQSSFTTTNSNNNSNGSSFSLFGIDFSNTLGLFSGSVVAYIANLSGSYENGLFSAGGNLYAGKAYADWDTKFNIFDWKEEYKKYLNGETKNEESLFIGGKFEGGAGISFFSGDGKINYGTDYLGVGVGAEGDLLTAYLDGKIKIGGTYEDGKWSFDAVAKGDALVAAAKGEVKGTVNILGIKITPKIGGYAGALGVEGKIGYESGEGFVVKGGAAAVFGISGGVSVGWDADGFMNSMDMIGSFAADAWDFIVFWK